MARTLLTSPCKGEVGLRSRPSGGQTGPPKIPTRRVARVDLPLSGGGWERSPRVASFALGGERRRNPGIDHGAVEFTRRIALAWQIFREMHPTFTADFL